jgi:hypothetical protein
MAAEIIQIDTQDFTSQIYEGQDTNLISTFDLSTSFVSSSYIESFIYDNNRNIITFNYNFTDYTIYNDGQSAGSNGNVSQITIDPEQFLIDNGFDQGEYITYFNFFNNKIGSELQPLYIAEISSDRTEIRLDSTTLSNLDIVEQANQFIQEREDSTYFLDFYLNFGENNLSIANNLQLDDADPINPTVLIKLYEPLPEEFDINSVLWVVTTFEEPVAYQVTFEDEPIVLNDFENISGPNFNIDLKDRVNNSTQNLSYENLVSTSLTSSIQQLNSLLEEKEIDINVDYTSFENFTHFSSVQTRLENFYSKIQLIEQYSSSIAILNNTTNSSASISSSATVYESKIDNIITNFDGYEYFLYYESSSYAWPKTNSQKPYELEQSNNPIVLNWIGSADESNSYFGGLLYTASLYDNNNKDNLYFSIPEYLREDPANDQYLLFIDMVGQFYDNIWIYYKDVTQKYNADNRLEYGISKDIVADAIRDFGIKLYQNNFSNEDLYTAFLGLTPEGGLFPFPNITGSLPTPSGYEYVNTLISASSDYIPLDDVNKSLYKRIYHNLPYLLKAKGTIPGLRALITSYGIPDTILRINEYGGKDKVNSNDWDYWQDEFNYAFNTRGNNYLFSRWNLNSNWGSSKLVPLTIGFRFKPTDFPPSDVSQSLLSFNVSSTTSIGVLSLEYTGSGLTSGSYSGSIVDPYYQYAKLTLYPSSSNLNLSASVYLPFYDGNWWSVMLTSGSNGYTLHAGNKIYEGGDNNTVLGFYSTSSVTSSYNSWDNSIRINYCSSSLFSPYIGNLQEIRYYKNPLSESVFKDYIMNPYSIEGNSLNTSPEELIFRAPLGGELYTGSVSIHPKITGSWASTQSFSDNTSNISFFSTPEYTTNREYFFYDQPIAGIKNTISDKIRIEDNVMPGGDTLSQYKALSQQSNISQSYTPNINYLEVAFSPTNEINEDIMDQIGSFNIGEFIGDPRLRSSSAVTYPALDQLQNAYFQKYTKNYDLVDFIRLIKFFDNSLFKMIRDFVPARTSLASGVVVKQHLLERNKYPQPQMEWEDLDISGTLKPTWNDYEPGTVEHFEGSTGGSFNQFNLITNTAQSWTESINTPSGSVLVIHNSQDEFYNGEFSGSTILVSNGILNEAYPINTQSFLYRPVYYYGDNFNESNIFENNFLNPLTSPNNGEILFDTVRLTSTALIDSWKYIKIAKLDCSGSDNTIVLGQINTLLVETPLVGFGNYWITYNITVLNEQSNYYLYKVNNSSISYFNSLYPNQVFDYTVSASKTTSQVITTPLVGTYPIITNYQTEIGDILNYFNLSTGIYTLGNTPNTPLLITASFTNAGDASLGSGNAFIEILRNGVRTQLSSISSFTTTSPTTVIISASYYALQGDQLYLRATKNGVAPSTDYTITNVQLSLTQSRLVSTSSCEPVIFEPYLTTPNFYNSDENALLNNAFDLRDSSYYMDVDYTRGITEPVNFDQLISGSATRAKVQDSNYTTQRHIIPRYLGSKSTSQQLNKWTEGDAGTYGKLPTVENLKTYVAYGEMGGSWAPERMNASTFQIKYLIKEDGTIDSPNVSENSLQNNQGTFQSGERFKISSTVPGGGEATEYRTVIRGGTRIEPILYTQIGHSPASWNNVTMSFTTDFITSAAVGNYTAKSSPSSSNPTFGEYGDFAGIDFNNNVLIGTNASSWSNNAYVVNSGIILENVTLRIKVHIEPVLRAGTIANQIHYAAARLIRKRGANETILEEITIPLSLIISTTTSFPFGETNADLPFNNIDFDYLIQPQNLQPNDEIFIRAAHITSTYGNTIPAIRYKKNSSYFQVSQIPSPTSTQVTSSGTNTLWGYPDNTKLYAITASNPVLNDLYDQGFRQVDITGSGFNTISLPWSIKYGDEFRFEGNENNNFIVKKIYDVTEVDDDRVSQTGSIEVQFGGTLPSASINLDHFLIRRYVDDASQVLFEGFKPTNSQGPYIITPEYVTPSLNQNIDTFITDLTQKGLI